MDEKDIPQVDNESIKSDETTALFSENIENNAEIETEATAFVKDGIEQFDDNTNDNSDDSENKTDVKLEIFEWVENLVQMLALLLVLNFFVFRFVTVDGSSMKNTLEDKDMLVVTNLCYEPKVGDIVVVQANYLPNRTTGTMGEPIIKRVIGLSGDVMRFDFENRIVYRNGEALEEDYIAQPTRDRESLESGVDYVVPDNCVFVMGDNRNASTDSRDSRVGFVDKDLIFGKALFRFMPFNKIGSVYE